MSDGLIELEETATHTGPKGVINDWRRFKLESMDQENLPPAKRELLRQMSSPNRVKDASRANLNRKVQYNPVPIMLNQCLTLMVSK
uniref:Phosducin domain-containing protein n=1 Tax=Amphilophus citrinellus TaxID=61819 RepID=A0A3Q0RWH4_AMPCI